MWLLSPARRLVTSSLGDAGQLSGCRRPHVPGHCLWPEGPQPCRPRPSALLLSPALGHGAPGYRVPPESTRADPGQHRWGVSRASMWDPWFSGPGLGAPACGTFVLLTWLPAPHPAQFHCGRDVCPGL